MIYIIYEWLKEDFGDLVNVFSYISTRGLAAAVMAFLLTTFFGGRVIRMLFALKLGQPIRTADEVGKLGQLHEKKSGTPTMGGVLILGSVLISTLFWARLDNPFVLLCLFVTVALGALGFMDDYKKVTEKKADGISARIKMGVQLAVAVVVTLVLILVQHPNYPDVMTTIYIPFVNATADIHPNVGWFFLIFVCAVIIGCSNAVNLTDGLDGLAIGCTITTAITYAIFNYVAGRTDYSSYLFVAYHPWSAEVTIFCMAIAGAGLGFLWFNCHPARVFMGDTGSLAIGGMLGTAAICAKQEIILIVVGGVFVMEAMSVILQVASFKMTGKRIFAMAPIHHHFELKGWPENKVIVRFWILSIIFAGLGLASLKLR